MLTGIVNQRNDSVVRIPIANREWAGIVDTGFTDDLELPEELMAELSPKYIGLCRSFLAAGKSVIEELYELRFPFDGEQVVARATFVPGKQVLLGAGIMQCHRLEVDYPARIVRLVRKEGG